MLLLVLSSIVLIFTPIVSGATATSTTGTTGPFFGGTSGTTGAVEINLPYTPYDCTGTDFQACNGEKLKYRPEMRIPQLNTTLYEDQWGFKRIYQAGGLEQLNCYLWFTSVNPNGTEAEVYDGVRRYFLAWAYAVEVTCGWSILFANWESAAAGLTDRTANTLILGDPSDFNCLLYNPDFANNTFQCKRQLAGITADTKTGTHSVGERELESSIPYFVNGNFNPKAVWYLDALDQSYGPLDGQNLYDGTYCYNCNDGRNATLIHIDSGVDVRHPEFLREQGNVASTRAHCAENYFLGQWSYYPPGYQGMFPIEDECIDRQGHGTATLASAIGRYQGVLRDATAYYYNVIYARDPRDPQTYGNFDAAGHALSHASLQIARGEWKRPAIATTQMGTLTHYDLCVNFERYPGNWVADCFANFMWGIKVAYSYGILFHISAGNGINLQPAPICEIQRNAQLYNYYSPTVLMTEPLNVGGYDKQYNLGWALYDAPGPYLARFGLGSNYGDCVDIYGPAIDIGWCAYPLDGPACTVNDTYRVLYITGGWVHDWSGTSFSTPIVAALSLAYLTSKSRSYHYHADNIVPMGQTNRYVEAVRTAMLQNGPRHNSQFGQLKYSVAVPIKRSQCTDAYQNS